LTNVCQPCQDWFGVPPDREDPLDPTVDEERQVLADVVRRGRGARGGVRRLLDQLGVRRPGDCGGAEVLVSGRVRRGVRHGAGRGHDRAVGAAELYLDDLARPDERRELGFEASNRGAATAVGGEDARVHVGVDEGAGRGGVAAHHIVERGGGEVGRDHDGLSRGRDPHQGEEGPEYE
jgi:hypothetical protein